VVNLSDTATGIDIRQQGQNLVVTSSKPLCRITCARAST
jgi:hypothetical protein